MAIKRWKLNTGDPAAERALALELGISPLAARVLAARGFADASQASAFLGCAGGCGDPFALTDMELAVARIREALEREEIVAVFGDYDADGLTATTLMYRCLSGMGARVVCALPSREGTGYGLSRDSVDALAENGVTLIVTVDNGVSAFDEVDYAKTLGIDTVVTDHHVLHGELPRAVAVVDPHRADDGAPFKDLAGVGVALKLAAALQECSTEEAVEEYGLLAAVGTIGDIMPLRGENRYIVQRGLAQFTQCDSAGLLALCAAAGVDPAAADEGTVAYAIAPRLNAAGRMGNAELSLALLLTDDEEEAARLASELEALNRSRQEAEQEAAEIIRGILCKNPDLFAQPVLVIAGDEFHSGVMGIVCSRLVERYNKPVVVISVEGDCAKGSGRSIGGFSLYKMIEACSDLLEKYGGHDMAAGFTLKTERLPALRERIFRYCREQADRFALPELALDGEVAAAEITEDAVAGLRALAPFGSGNREPVFLLRGAAVAGVYALGEKHTRVALKKDGRQFYAAVFGAPPSEFAYSVGETLDAALSLTIYCGKDRSMVSVKAIDLRRSDFSAEDLSSYEEYRRFGFSGRVPAGSPLAATREDAAVVYRRLLRQSVPAGGDASLSGEFGALPLGRALALLDVFLELGLAELTMQDGRRVVAAKKGAAKRELQDSAVYRALIGEAAETEAK